MAKLSTLLSISEGSSVIDLQGKSRAEVKKFPVSEQPAVSRELPSTFDGPAFEEFRASMCLDVIPREFPFLKAMNRWDRVIPPSSIIQRLFR
jgi:hypothetical protein